jgi:hypothetical protein
MNTIPSPPDKPTDRLAPSHRTVHSQSTRLCLGPTFTALRQSLQEMVARPRILDAIHAAAARALGRRVTLKPLVKRILVALGHRLVGWPAMKAFFTWAVCRSDLRDV